MVRSRNRGYKQEERWPEPAMEAIILGPRLSFLPLPSSPHLPITFSPPPPFPPTFSSPPSSPIWNRSHYVTLAALGLVINV